jgi:uncharacterized membrane protein
MVTLAGGLVIGVVAAAGATSFWLSTTSLLAVGGLAGAGGALLDSVLGATLQAGYRCPACACASEGAVHPCGSRTEHVRGLRWLDNDRVNLAATLGGALLGVATARALG